MKKEIEEGDSEVKKSTIKNEINISEDNVDIEDNLDVLKKCAKFLELPSLGFFILIEVVKMGSFIFFYTVKSFITELCIIKINRYFWVLWILEGIIQGVGWVFKIIIWKDIKEYHKKEQVKMFGKTFTFIVYVFINLIYVFINLIYIKVITKVVSIGYCSMYCEFDTCIIIPAIYIRSWSKILILLLFYILIILFFLRFTLVLYYFRRVMYILLIDHNLK